jgi:hypothetical protein
LVRKFDRKTSDVVDIFRVRVFGGGGKHFYFLFRKNACCDQ